MASEPDQPDEWHLLDTYADRLAAEVHAGWLRNGMVAAKVELIGDLPGQERGARLWVNAALADRAHSLLKQGSIGEAELEELAIGRLSRERRERAQRQRKPSFLLRAISVFLLLGVLFSVTSLYYMPLPPEFAPRLTFVETAFIVFSAAVTALAAVGIWLHKRWGALLYFALIVFSQAFLLLLGKWHWMALAVPGVIIFLLVLKLPAMTPPMPVPHKTET